jgi:hypothetical protein
MKAHGRGLVEKEKNVAHVERFVAVLDLCLNALQKPK